MVATVFLLVLITTLFVGQWIEHKKRASEDRQAICAIRAYIEGQFRITATIAGAPPNVIAARRRVIRMFEDRMDGNCN